MSSKLYRMNQIVLPTDAHNVIVDTSRGLSLGPLPGLERFSDAVSPLLPLVHGIVSSPGQARRLAYRTKDDAALLVRADWTNTIRDESFVLPPKTNHYVSLLEPADAVDFGASAMVVSFLLGHEETVEAQCLETTLQAALKGTAIGLPLIVDVLPIGPRVVKRDKAIELGVSYALESGADGVAIPWPGVASMQNIKTMTGDVPVWIKPTSKDDTVGLSKALEIGAVGVWLGEWLFAASQPTDSVLHFINVSGATDPDKEGSR